MKKILSMVLAAALLLCLLAGCGGAPQSSSPAAPADSQPAQGADSQDAADEPAAAASIKVAALSSAYETAYPGMWQEVCDALPPKPASR